MTDKPISLEPKDWSALRQTAHDLLDQAFDHLEQAGEGRVWTPLPDEMKAALRAPLPRAPGSVEALGHRLAALLPYGVGNTHPRFFGWVHGSGAPGGLLPEIAAAAMNANLGGRDHGAIYVERQVVEWCREMMGFPEGSSGLLVSGTSMATLVALKVARDHALGRESRQTGLRAGLVGYASAQSHSCVARTFDILGLGTDALRAVPVNDRFEMEPEALRAMIAEDRAAGRRPFLIVGTAGTVNTGAVDPLPVLGDIATEEGLWFHIDGAFGAAARLAPEEAQKLDGLERADSLAWDFHKWFHVTYDAGAVLVRDGDAHLRAFTERPDYLSPATRGLAAGAPWPTDFGPELSRGFRALKVWSHLIEHGVDRIGGAVAQNCAQARRLGKIVDEAEDMELLAPVSLNIVCFRALGSDPDALNAEIVLRLQEDGIAAPSTTRINGALAIRVNLTNHRTRDGDLDLLLAAVRRLARDVTTMRD